jgi:mxaJ protein
MMSKIPMLLAALLFAVIWAAAAQPALGQELKELRACADPDNLPFSNRKSEGFENKIAEVIAKELGAELKYFWYPHQRGIVRRALAPGLCDVLMSIPQGWDPVLSTKPYYRSTYVIVHRKGQKSRVASLDDPILKQLKIGVYINSPPAEALGERGMQSNMVSYSPYFDYQKDRPGKIIEDVVSGEIDAAIVWGPIAGYAVKKLTAIPLELVPLHDTNKGVPLTFQFSMGIREGTKGLKARLDQAISKRQDEIRAILEDYGVPLLPLLSSEQFPKVEERPGQLIYRRWERDDPLESPR